jgi:hypothetical protein
LIWLQSVPKRAFTASLGSAFLDDDLLGIDVVDPGGRVLPAVLHPLAVEDTLRIVHRVALDAIDDVVRPREPGRGKLVDGHTAAPA